VMASAWTAPRNPMPGEDSTDLQQQIDLGVDVYW